MTTQPKTIQNLILFLIVLAVCGCGGSGRSQTDASVPDLGAVGGLDGAGVSPGDAVVNPTCGGPGLACCPGEACRDGGCCMNGICTVAGFACPTPGTAGTGGLGGMGGTGGTIGAGGALGGATTTTTSGGTIGGMSTVGTGGTVATTGKGGSTTPGTGGTAGGTAGGGGKAGTGGTGTVVTGGSTGKGGTAGGVAGGAGTTGSAAGGTGSAGTTGTAVGGSGGTASTGTGCAACSATDVCTSENFCVKPGTIDSFVTCDNAIEPLEGRLGQWNILVGSAVKCDYPPCAGISHPAWAPTSCAAWMAGSPAITETPEIYSTMDVALRPKDDPNGSLYDACKYKAVEITYDTSDKNLSVQMYAQWNGLAPYGQRSPVTLEGSETSVTKTIKFSQFGLKCEALAGFTFVPWAPRAGFRFSVTSLRFVTTL